LSSAVVKVICVRKVIAFSLIDRTKWLLNFNGIL
jgi:hypothetical protein